MINADVAFKSGSNPCGGSFEQSTFDKFINAASFGDAAQAAFSFITERLAVLHGGVDVAEERLTLEEIKNAAVLSCDAGFLTFGVKIKGLLRAAAENADVEKTACTNENGKKSGCDLAASAYSRTVFFSVEECDNEVIAPLLYSVNNLNAVVLIGDRAIVENSLSVLQKNGYAGGVLILPTDFSVVDLAVFNFSESFGEFRLFFDDKHFSSLKKGKYADAVRSVFSKRIAFVEMRVNELIASDLDFSRAKKLLNESVTLCFEYLKKYDYKKLVFAKTAAACALCGLPFGDDTAAIADILSEYRLKTEYGEREYLAYKILIKLYSIALASGVRAVRVPSYVLQREELKALMPAAEIAPPPEFYATDDELLKKIKDDRKICDSVKRLNAEIPRLEKIIYIIYGGKRRAEEDYPQSVLLQATKLAPLLTRGVTLLKAVWADGLLELV